MTATVLITGALHRDPVMRTAKTGKAFVTALLRSESQGETLWVNAVAFDEAAQAELMRLNAGESLSVQGAMKVSVVTNLASSDRRCRPVPRSIGQAESFNWEPGDLLDCPRDGAMGLAWWLTGRTVSALGPEHASAGQPAYDRVTRREWVNPYSRPVRPVSLSPILEHQQKIMQRVLGR